MTTVPTSPAERRQALRELLIRRRRAELVGGGVVPVGRDGLLPLSWQQLGLWFLYQWDPESATYHLPLVLRLRGELDREALAVALRAVIVRHEGLRTRFVVRDGQPWQLIDPPPPVVDLAVEDLPTHGWQEAVAAEVRRPFRLLTEPGFRYRLSRLADDDHVLILNAHHIITDGWSVAILTSDLSNAYRYARTNTDPTGGNGLAGLTPLPIQPADHAHWQHHHRDQLDTGLAYWATQLADLPTLQLPADRPRPALPTGAGAGLHATIEATTAHHVTALATQLQVSPLAVLLAAFSTVLHRYTGQTDIPLGSVFSNRTRTELEPIIGYLANAVVLRTHITDNPTITTHIHHCHDTIIHALQYQDTPFTLLVDTLKPPRTPGQNPLFQTSLSLLPPALGASPHFDDLPAVPVALEGGTARFDLSLQVVPLPDGPMTLVAEYSTELFDEQRIQLLVTHFSTALAEMVADPSQPLDSVLRLSEAEQRQVSSPYTSAPAVATDPVGQPAGGDATGQVLLEIWTELLRPATPLQPQDNFFTQGGSSLDLARLTTAIAERCGVHLAVRDLYLAPTLAAMAALVDEHGTDQKAAGGAARSALLPLRSGGSRPPVFLVHAIGGSAVAYLPLVELLDPQQPVYAFEAPGLHGRPERRGSTIESIAADYLEELRTVQPSGPYRLGGWSVGGMIAQQMAATLREVGEDVALLALLDAVPSDIDAAVPDHAGLIWWFVHDLASLRGLHLPDLDPELLRDVAEEEQLDRAMDHLQAHAIIDSADRAVLASRFEVFSALATAFLRHRPVPLDRPIELLAAADSAIDPVPRWQAVGGPLTVHPVPGNHYTMLQPPQVATVAAVLGRLLDRSHQQLPIQQLSIQQLSIQV
jgi:thioesterase domain-containing protein/aryl carrier-like protein